MTDRDAYIVLNLLPGIGSQRVQALIREFGSAAAILEKSHEELSMVRGIPAALAAKLANWQSETNLPLELELTDRGGARIITRADYDYPEILRHIPDPPLCLYVRGTLPEFDARTVAVVGSRRMSRYGRAMAAQLSRRGHDVRVSLDSGAFGRGQVIWRDPESGVLRGGTEGRADGHIACW